MTNCIIVWSICTDEDPAVEKKALALGAEAMVIDNLQQEFVDDLIWPAVQCLSSTNPYTQLVN